MTNPNHLEILQRGVDAWNAWRERDPDLVITPDLVGANLRAANLRRANFRRANLFRATLEGANLSSAYLSSADLNETNLTGANLSSADLAGANLTGANLRGANLRDAQLAYANLSRADLTDADLTGCKIYAVSAWDVKLNGTRQQDLLITPAAGHFPFLRRARAPEPPGITVDNIEVAQFIYLMLNNLKIREVIDTITSKVVLILGRFTEERKAVLDALRDELRKSNYLPILFDFEKPTSRDADETITLLARMARFVIADISDAKSVLQELRAIVPDLPNVPVQPVIVSSQEEPGMFDFYRRFPWFLPVHRYDTPAKLLNELRERVIEPSEAKVLEFRATTL
jgi:hypothetical protein